MENQFVLGGALASCLLLVFVLCRFAEKKKKFSGSRGANSSRFAEVSENGKCESDDVEDAEIIIVGAGVAGAALAYTLGKVGMLLVLSLQDPYALYVYDDFPGS